MNFEQEAINLEIINLFGKDFMNRNEAANTLKWYGQRLLMIRTFYNKTSSSISVATGFSRSYLSKYESNEMIPSKEFIKKVAFIFEVPERFFTDKNINIKITEQLKIEFRD